MGGVRGGAAPIATLGAAQRRQRRMAVMSPAAGATRQLESVNYATRACNLIWSLAVSSTARVAKLSWRCGKPSELSARQTE